MLQDDTGSILDTSAEVAEAEASGKEVANGTAAIPTVVPSLGLSIYAACWIRKGAPERIQFPTLSQTVSPFQQLGLHLAILGKKIDSAQVVQARPVSTCKVDGQERLEPHLANKKVKERKPQQAYGRDLVSSC